MQKTGKIVIFSILIMMAFVGIASADVTATNDPTTTLQVQPVIREDANIKCDSEGLEFVTSGYKLNFDVGTLKFDGVEYEYAMENGKSIFIKSYYVGDNQLFPALDWRVEGFVVDAVIVKGGAGGRSNVYMYDPAVSGDTGLHSPPSANGGWGGLSHIELCGIENVPEFPAIAVPVGMLVGFLGVVSVVRSKKE